MLRMSHSDCRYIIKSTSLASRPMFPPLYICGLNMRLYIYIYLAVICIMIACALFLVELYRVH